MSPPTPCIHTNTYTGSLNILIMLHAVQSHFKEIKGKSPEIEGVKKLKEIIRTWRSRNHKNFKFYLKKLMERKPIQSPNEKNWTSKNQYNIQFFENFKGHNSKAPCGIQLIIELGLNFVPTYILIKFVEDWIETNWVREQKRKVWQTDSRTAGWPDRRIDRQTDGLTEDNSRWTNMSPPL